MKILISSAGSHGDVLPFVAIGKEMRARGHEVVLFANPSFQRFPIAAGLRFVPIGTVDGYARLVRDNAESDPYTALRRVSAYFAEICRDYYTAMKAEVAARETIAIGHSLLFAPRLLRETDDVPCAAVHLGPSVFRSNLRPARLVPNWIGPRTPEPVKRAAWWAADTFTYDPHFARPLNALRAELGLAPVARIFRSWIHEADCVVAMFPDWFAPRQADWPARAVLAGFPLYDDGAQPLSDPLAEFIEAGPAPVAFTAGTANADAKGFFETSVAACRLAGLRGVLISASADSLPERLPADVVRVAYAPFKALLPKMAAFVHHGGIGSTAEALRAGVPQLIRPVAYDQFDNAAHATRLGVAVELSRKRYAARPVADALARLMSDVQVRERCREAASRFGGRDAVEIACDAILAGCAAAP